MSAHGTYYLRPLAQGCIYPQCDKVAEVELRFRGASLEVVGVYCFAHGQQVLRNRERAAARARLAELEAEQAPPQKGS